MSVDSVDVVWTQNLNTQYYALHNFSHSATFSRLFYKALLLTAASVVSVVLDGWNVYVVFEIF